MEEEGRKVRREEVSLDERVVARVRKAEDEMSLDRLICEPEPGTNVAQLLNDIKHETMDDDLQNLDTGFLQGMNLHNLVREFEMDTATGSELNLLSLADDLQ